MAARRERLLLLTAALVVLVAFVANIGFVLWTSSARLLDGVEGEVLFEASRMRDGMKLYVDPIAGAFDYGSVPSRYYVLYLPIWAWLLHFVPAADAPLIARAMASGLWFGLLGVLVVGSDPNHRRIALWAAMFVGGTYTLTLFSASGRPDSLAIALSGIAALRTTKRARVDPITGGLFALAACVKPNVVGLGAGMFAVDVWQRRTKAWPGALGAACVVGVVGGALEVTTHGAWIRHLLLGTAQPLDLHQWTDQVLGRGQMMGSLVTGALVCGWCARRTPGGALALGALGASTAWTLLCSAKIGSASNYWLEPCVGAVIVLGRSSISPVLERGKLAGACFVLVQSMWSGVASTRSVVEWGHLIPERRRALDVARAGLEPASLVMADEPGLELALDGRLLATPFQMTHLVWSGKYPVALWETDIDRIEVQGAVLMDDLLERPLSVVDVAHDRFPLEIRRLLRERFTLRAVRGGFYVYRRKEPPMEPFSRVPSPIATDAQSK